MAKDDLLFFGHMLDAARGAISANRGVTREEFDADENLRLAQAHRIQRSPHWRRRLRYTVLTLGFRRARGCSPSAAFAGAAGDRHRGRAARLSLR